MRCAIPGRLLIIAGAILSVAAPAAAQDEPRFALLARFPTPTVSFQWQASDRFAVRVEGSYELRDEMTDTVTSGFWDSRGVVTAVSTSTVESKASSTSFVAAGVITLHRDDRNRLYCAPRVVIDFSRQRTAAAESHLAASVEHLYGDGTTSQVIFGDGTLRPSTETTYTTSSTSPGAGVSFGAASRVLGRVALFGEAGITYIHSRRPLAPITPAFASSLQSGFRRSTTNTHASAGIMFLF